MKQIDKKPNEKKSKKAHIVYKEIEILPDGRMTTQAAAEFLGLAVSSIYKHRDDPDMPPYVKIRKRKYYYYDDLVKWLENFKKK